MSAWDVGADSMSCAISWMMQLVCCNAVAARTPQRWVA